MATSTDLDEDDTEVLSELHCMDLRGTAGEQEPWYQLPLTGAAAKQQVVVAAWGFIIAHVCAYQMLVCMLQWPRAPQPQGPLCTRCQAMHM